MKAKSQFFLLKRFSLNLENYRPQNVLAIWYYMITFEFLFQQIHPALDVCRVWCKAFSNNQKVQYFSLPRLFLVEYPKK